MPNSLLYRPEVAVIGADAELHEAAKLMRDHHVGSVVVIESASTGTLHPIGLLTDRDIVVEVIAEGIDPKKIKVRDIMSHDPITAQHNATLEELINLMRNAQVRRLPIVDERKQLVGFVSFDDLLEKVGTEISSLSQISHHQQKHEKQVRPARATPLT